MPTAVQQLMIVWHLPVVIARGFF